MQYLIFLQILKLLFHIGNNNNNNNNNDVVVDDDDNDDDDSDDDEEILLQQQQLADDDDADYVAMQQMSLIKLLRASNCVMRLILPMQNLRWQLISLSVTLMVG